MLRYLTGHHRHLLFCCVNMSEHDNKTDAEVVELAERAGSSPAFGTNKMFLQNRCHFFIMKFQKDLNLSRDTMGRTVICIKIKTQPKDYTQLFLIF